jgi:hypothetical protein
MQCVRATTYFFGAALRGSSAGFTYAMLNGPVPWTWMTAAVLDRKK